MPERTNDKDSQTTSTLLVVMLVSAGLSILGAGPLLLLASAADETAEPENPQAMVFGADDDQETLSSLQVALAPDDDTTFSLHGATVSGTLFVVISPVSSTQAVSSAQLDGVPLDVGDANLVSGPIGGLLRIDASTLASGRHELEVTFAQSTGTTAETESPHIVTFFVAER